jgi:hypothetical protein
MWDLWWTKLHWGRFSPSTSVSFASSHSNNCSTSSSFNIRRWYNRPINGRHTKWTQSHPTPRNLKKTSHEIVSLSWLSSVCYCVQKTPHAGLDRVFTELTVRGALGQVVLCGTSTKFSSLHTIIRARNSISTGKCHIIIIIIVTCMGDSRRGFGLYIGFTDHLYTRLKTTKQLRRHRYLHNSQITTAPTKPFPACCVFTSLSLATASNSGDSSASRARVLSL